MTGSGSKGGASDIGLSKLSMGQDSVAATWLKTGPASRTGRFFDLANRTDP